MTWPFINGHFPQMWITWVHLNICQTDLWIIELKIIAFLAFIGVVSSKCSF